MPARERRRYQPVEATAYRSAAAATDARPGESALLRVTLSADPSAPRKTPPKVKPKYPDGGGDGQQGELKHLAAVKLVLVPGLAFDGSCARLGRGKGYYDAFFARLRGPGHVWIQSLPFSRLAGRMLAAAGSRGGQNRGEGSVLGEFGDLIGGNR